MILIALAAAAAAPQPGKIATFKDWTVGCDNIRHCEVVALMPEDGDISDSSYLRIVIERDGARDAPVTATISFDAPPPRDSKQALAVDGRVVQALVASSSDAVVLTLDPGVRAALLKGSTVSVLRDGKSIGRASLAGLSAALRFVDAEQKRAGTVTALVATGTATMLPPVPPAPVIRMALPPAGAERAIKGAENAALKKRFNCDGDLGGPQDSEAHPLAPGKTLILLACGGGAYNFTAVPLIAVGKTVSVAPFDLRPSWGEEGGQAALVNAGWDAKKGELTSYAKGRGLGDCGSAQTYVWDGARFRLVEERTMGECRGSVDWMRVWTATVVR